MSRFLPADHSKGDERTIGGYAAVHARPAAFEGRDGLSYSVEIMSDPVGTRVRAFILSNFMVAPEDSNFLDSDSLLSLGIIDSMGVLEIAAFLEVEFGVNATPSQIRPENFDSINAIAAFVGKARGS